MSKELFSEDIRKAVEVMQRGGIILYPTDTIWGIGCDATNESAVQKIYALKKRSDSKSMLVLVDSDVKLQGLVSEVPEIAYDLIDLAIRPITIIYSGARNVAPSLITDEGTLGIRVTKEEFSQELCKRMRVPVVSTSANISGEPSAAFFSQISPEILAGVDYVVEYRRDDNSPSEPSQIISLGSGGEVKVIRE